MKTVFIAQLRQAFPKNQTSRYLRHRNISHLGQERNSPAGPWIDLNDIDLLILDDELNIHHANTVESQSQTLGIVCNSILDFLR